MENVNSATHYRVFISYRGADYESVKPIYDFLTSFGLSVFLAPNTLRERGKSDYTREIEDAIIHSDHMIVFASKPDYLNPHNHENAWVCHEWDLFKSRAIEKKKNGKNAGNLILITPSIFDSELKLSFTGKENFMLSNYKEGIFQYIRPLGQETSSSDNSTDKMYVQYHPDVVISNLSEITSNAPVIMAERGEVKNGFDNNTYFERPYSPNKLEGETIDEHIQRIVEQNSVTIITGTYGMGKSRSVYEYLKRIANCSNPAFKQVVALKNQHELSCSFRELKEYFENLLKAATGHKLIIYIDNLHNKKDKDGKHGLSEWTDIFRVVKDNNAHIIVSCLDSPTKEEQTSLVDISPAIITLPEVDKKKTYLACRTKWHAKHYSPIIGNYVDGMENFKRLIKKKPMEEGEIVLLSVYLFINHYFHSRGKDRDFLESVYKSVGGAIPDRCSTLGHNESGIAIGSEFSGNPEENIPAKKEYKFERALKLLCNRNILKNKNNRYFLYDEIFADQFSEVLCSHNYLKNTELTENDKILRRVCADLVTKREDLLFLQERWLAQLVINLEKDTPDFYARTITRASLQNTKKIARSIKILFDKHFFELDKSKNLIRLRDKYLHFEKEITHTIGIILSRCYDEQHWKEHLLQYEKAGIAIKEDENIVGELLRMAADQRTCSEFKRSILSFIEDYLLDGTLADFSKQHIRIAVNYAFVSDKIGNDHLLSILRVFKKKFDDVQNDYDQSTESDDYEDYTYDEDVDDSVESDDASLRFEAKHLVRSFKNWSKYVCLKINSPASLQELITILSEENTQEYLTSINKVMYNVRALLGPGYETLECVFLSDYSLAAIAQRIHRYSPLCYLDWYKKCIDLLDSAKKTNYILNSKTSYKGFIIHASYVNDVKTNMGALIEVETIEDAFNMIDELKRIGLLNDKDFGINSFYATCMYEVFNKIENYKNDNTIDGKDVAFKAAIDYVDDRYKSIQEIGGKIKLYNNLLLHTPTFAKAVELMESKFLKEKFTIDTINNFFSRAKKAYKRKDAQKNYILKQILEKAAWVESKEACLLDDISYSILASIRLPEDVDQAAAQQYTELLNSLKRNLTSRPLNKIKRSKEWQIPFKKEIAEDIIARQEQLEAFKEQLGKAISRLETLRKYFVGAPKKDETSEELLLFSSDSISNLMSSFEYIINKENVWDEKTSELLNRIRQLLVELIVEKQIDNYFKPKLYYYDKARNLCLGNLDYNGKWLFIEHAIDRLVECHEPFIMNEDRDTPQKNLLENVISSLPFEEALELVKRAKNKAKLEAYRDLYTPTAIKMLCNKLRKGLPSAEEDAMTTLVKRIAEINKLISDPEIMLVFDADNAKLISSINGYVRGKKNGQDSDPVYPFFPSNVKISIPLQLCNINYFVFQIMTKQDEDRLNLYNTINISYLVSQHSSLAKDVVYDRIMRSYISAYKRTCVWLKNNKRIGYRRYEPDYFDSFIEPYLVKDQESAFAKIKDALRHAQNKAIENYRKELFNNKKVTPSNFAQSEIKTIVDFIYDGQYVDLTFFVKALSRIPKIERQVEYERIITWYLSEHKTCQFIMGNRGYKDYIPPYFCDFAHGYITDKLKPEFDTVSLALNNAQDNVRSKRQKSNT